MRKTAFCLAALLLCSCSAPAAELPEPAELYAAITEAVELPEMADVSGDYLESVLDLGPDEFDSGVYYLLEEGLAPDELVIIRAKDGAGAEAIREKLEEHLAYKEEAARVYLTEFMPVIQEGVVRRDGLTVSLIVSEQVEQIIQVYQQYK